MLALILLCSAGAASAQTENIAKVAFDPAEKRPAAVSSTIGTATDREPSSPNIAVSRVGVQTATPIPLALDEAIRRALSNNNSIEIARDDVRIQETTIRSLLGVYDPVFTVTPTFTRSSTTGNSATNDFNANANFQHLIRQGGGDYQVFFNNTRTENRFSQAQVSSGSIGSGGTSAIFSTSLGIRYRQPLFRNFGIDNNRRNIRIARRILEQTDADFRRQTIDTIAQVQRTYWDLVFALRDQQNRVQNVNLAKENLRQVEARIDAGAAAPLARAEVETELANREGDLLLATQQVSTTENQLKQLILKDASAAEWTMTFVPTDKPAFNLTAVNMDAAIKDAIDNRFELRRLRLARDINAVDITYFKNQTKPQIDFNTTLSLDGLSLGNASGDTILVPQYQGNDNALRERLNELLMLHGRDTIDQNVTPVAGTPPYLIGGFNRSFSNLFRSDAPNVSFGVTLSFPLRNQTAKANLAGAQIAHNQIEAQLRQQEQAVIVEVRNAVQAVETSRQRVLTARRARENAEKQLEGERQLLESGRSTTFLLFQRENALTAARNAEIRAETDYNKALADLQQVTSTTFEMNNIVVESPSNDK
ncbi:MAG: TolC family protein [Pyrinomonadaceae bacterium]